MTGGEFLSSFATGVSDPLGMKRQIGVVWFGGVGGDKIGVSLVRASPLFSWIRDV